MALAGVRNFANPYMGGLAIAAAATYYWVSSDSIQEASNRAFSQLKECYCQGNVLKFQELLQSENPLAKKIPQLSQIFNCAPHQGPSSEAAERMKLSFLNPKSSFDPSLPLEQVKFLVRQDVDIRIEKALSESDPQFLLLLTQSPLLLDASPDALWHLLQKTLGQQAHLSTLRDRISSLTADEIETLILDKTVFPQKELEEMRAKLQEEERAIAEIRIQMKQQGELLNQQIPPQVREKIQDKALTLKNELENRKSSRDAFYREQFWKLIHQSLDQGKRMEIAKALLQSSRFNEISSRIQRLGEEDLVNFLEALMEAQSSIITFNEGVGEESRRRAELWIQEWKETWFLTMNSCLKNRHFSQILENKQRREPLFLLFCASDYLEGAKRLLDLYDQNLDDTPSFFFQKIFSSVACMGQEKLLEVFTESKFFQKYADDLTYLSLYDLAIAFSEKLPEEKLDKYLQLTVDPFGYVLEHPENAFSPLEDIRFLRDTAAEFTKLQEKKEFSQNGVLNLTKNPSQFINKLNNITLYHLYFIARATNNSLLSDSIGNQLTKEDREVLDDWVDRESNHELFFKLGTFYEYLSENQKQSQGTASR